MKQNKIGSSKKVPQVGYGPKYMRAMNSKFKKQMKTIVKRNIQVASGRR